VPGRAPNLSFFSRKVEKRNSPIDGRGLFAKEEIEAGEIVVVKGGYILTRAQRDAIGRELGPAEIQITEDLFIGPATRREREGGMMHLNHSCEPNLGIQGQLVYVTLRKIAAGEELTFDYAMNDDEPWEMHCRCGSRLCRGTITGRDWQKPELQQKYDGYFSWFIQRRIDARAGVAVPVYSSSNAADTAGRGSDVVDAQDTSAISIVQARAGKDQ
jgi:hypothetical protein